MADDPLGDGSDYGITGEWWGMTNETTSAIDEAENHMRILRAWGTATPMWAADTITRLQAALTEIREAVSKRQLPITNQVYEIADRAIKSVGG